MSSSLLNFTAMRRAGLRPAKSPGILNMELPAASRKWLLFLSQGSESHEWQSAKCNQCWISHLACSIFATETKKPAQPREPALCFVVTKNFPLKHALDKSRTVSSKHMQALGKRCLFWWWLLKYAVVKLIKSRSKAKPWQTTMPEEWRYDHPLFQSLQCWEKASKSLIIIMMMMDKKTNDGRWQHATPMGSNSRVDHVNPQSRPHQHSFGYTSP